MKLKTFLLISVQLLMPFTGQAQFIDSNVTEIIVEKSGKLEGALKKANALNAKKLSIKEPEGNPITAKLNEKDLFVLAGMSQLEELYLDIDIDDSGSYKYTSKNGKITNANFPNLKIIGIGDETRGDIYGLFHLKVQSLVTKGGRTSLPDGISFDEIYIVPESNGREGEYYDERRRVRVVQHSFSGKLENYLEHRRRVVVSFADLSAMFKSVDTNNRTFSIHVKSLDNLDDELCKQMFPGIVYVHNGSEVKKYLVDYNRLASDEDKDLTKYDGILPTALNNCSFDTLRLPDTQKTLGECFFYNVTANVLDLNKVTAIGQKAFYKSHVKELHIPATVQDINNYAFMGFDNDSEISTVYMEGEYAPSIGSAYNYRDIQFIIPKGTRSNYDLGEWKKLKVLEDGATTNYTFDVKEPGTLVSLLTDEIIQNVTSLKLRGILYSDDIKLLEKCLNLKYLDISETFIAQSPKELKEKQEESEYLAQMFVNMGVIAQSEYEHYRMSTTDNLQVQLLAKLGEMAKNQKITSDPNCQLPILGDTHVEELILPLQLQKVVAGKGMIPETIKKITLPPDLKEFSIYPHIDLTEIVLPSSVKSIKLLGSNIGYDNLQLIDMSACENPSIEIEGDYNKPLTIKFPETYTNLKVKIGGYQPVNAYFKRRELSGYFFNYKSEESTIYIPRGSRAGYSSLVQNGYKVIEQ